MEPKTSLKSGWVCAFGCLCAGVIFFFLFRELWGNWAGLKAYDWKLDIGLGALSFLVLMASLFLLPWGISELLALLGHRLPYRRMCRIFFVSMMAKYLPGGWWAFVGRAHLYTREGVVLPCATVAVLMETILVATSGIFIFSIFSHTHSRLFAETGKIPLLLTAVTCLLLIHPRPLNYVLSLAGKIFRKEITLQPYSYWRMFFPFSIFLLFWIGMGGSFWLLACSLSPANLASLPQMVGAFSLSWVLGFLSFLTPGGLGVREGALTLMLQPVFPIFIAAVLSLLSRVLWILGEILGLVLSILWERMGGRKRQSLPGLGLSPLPGVRGNIEK
jgi:glycosyltransferase 2 family protein